MQQGVVGAVVAHQNGAQQSLAVLAHHHAPVVAGLLIVKTDIACTRGLGVGIADGAHIHPQQLELGAHVGAGKGRAGVFVQSGRQGARHGVTRSHQSEDAIVPERAFTDGVNVRV